MRARVRATLHRALYRIVAAASALVDDRWSSHPTTRGHFGAKQRRELSQRMDLLRLEYFASPAIIKC